MLKQIVETRLRLHYAYQDTTRVHIKAVSYFTIHSTDNQYHNDNELTKDNWTVALPVEKATVHGLTFLYHLVVKFININFTGAECLFFHMAKWTNSNKFKLHYMLYNKIE